MAPNNMRFAFVGRLLMESRRKRRLAEARLRTLVEQRRRQVQVALLAVLLLTASRQLTAAHGMKARRTCRRLPRNQGWWNVVWNTYSDSRFKRTFRVSRGTFEFILSKIRHRLERQTLCEEPISPEFRLGICLYRLGRGDYLYTVAEMAGVGLSTVAMIVSEVCKAITECMWEQSVHKFLPKTTEEFKEKMLDTEELWQFPFSWAAVDGCHIPIKCPPGGLESCKEYHNFKNFYSVVLMAMVDAKYRFVWGSCGFPGNSHDSVILQATSLWNKIQEGSFLPDFSNSLEGVMIPPLIIGDSAFPFEKWLMKPYTNAVLTPKQRYFNYRLSRARMVIEGAYGQLKGRWRILMRKSESSHEEVKVYTLACMVLHNVCLEKGDTIPRKLDPSIDRHTNEKRDRKELQEILHIGLSRKRPFEFKGDSHANKIRAALTSKFWAEKESAANNEKN